MEALVLRLVVSVVALFVAAPVLADEPIVPPPPTQPPPPAVPAEPAVPPPPVVSATPSAPALPPGVTPVQDSRPVTFVLTGGNRVVARRIGEDVEFFWVETEGRTARIRKADIASVDFQPGLAQPPPPAVPARFRARDEERFTNVPEDTPAPKGRGMVIWGSIMLGLGYTAAIAGTIDNSDDGTEYLLLLPIAGPFLYAATGADRAEAGPWIIDGLLQAGGLVLLYAGIRRMQETPTRRRHQPFLDVSLGPRGGFARATWEL